MWPTERSHCATFGSNTKAPDQELGKVDLELVTGDYHAQGLAAKAQTGFAMYALPEDAARLRPAVSDPEIMLDILSL